jgi:hypothetical protein
MVLQLGWMIVNKAEGPNYASTDEWASKERLSKRPDRLLVHMVCQPCDGMQLWFVALARQRIGPRGTRPWIPVFKAFESWLGRWKLPEGLLPAIANSSERQRVITTVELKFRSLLVLVQHLD